MSDRESLDAAIAECHERGWGFTLYAPPGARPAVKVHPTGRPDYVADGVTPAEALRNAMAYADRADAPLDRSRLDASGDVRERASDVHGVENA